MKETHLLVVGSDGLVGKALCSRALAESVKVTKLSHRKKSAGPGANEFEFDLTDEAPLLGVDLSSITHGVVLAGVTSIAACENQPEITWRTNVIGMQRVVSTLTHAGIAVTVASSSQVFSRFLQSPSVNSPRRPVCEYGRQKVALEDSIGTLPGVQIVRFTKILAPSSPLVRFWIDAARRGQFFSAFSNVTVAPISLASAVNMTLHLAVADHYPRIVHCSSLDDFSYFDFARCILEALGIDPSFVQSRAVEESASNGWIVGPHAALGECYPEVHSALASARGHALQAISDQGAGNGSSATFDVRE